MTDETKDQPPVDEPSGEESTAAAPGTGETGAQEAPASPAAPEEAAAQAPAEEPPKAETADTPEPASPPPASDAPETGGAEEDAEAKAKAAAAAKAKAEAAAKAKAAHEAAEAAKEIWERDPVIPEWEAADDDPLVEALRSEHPEAILTAQTFAGDLTMVVERDSVRDVCATLKNDQGYLLPVDICGADYPDREEGRFDVVYHLYNMETNRRIRLKVVTDEETPVPSVTPVWIFANWPEREVYDMYGVRFSDHPDMSRILLWDGFNGYPLRKDFPVEGIDTGSAIYPEFYEDDAGPVAGTGTGWKPPEPPEPEEADGSDMAPSGDEA
jgi:NADH-quinone oxidoreductase subunit C